jgi:hypothetical protein
MSTVSQGYFKLVLVFCSDYDSIAMGTAEARGTPIYATWDWIAEQAAQ